MNTKKDMVRRCPCATRALTYMEWPTTLLAVTPSRKTRGGCRALLTFYSRYGVRLYLPHKAYSDNIYRTYVEMEKRKTRFFR